MVSGAEFVAAFGGAGVASPLVPAGGAFVPPRTLGAEFVAAFGSVAGGLFGVGGSVGAVRLDGNGVEMPTVTGTAGAVGAAGILGKKPMLFSRFAPWYKPYANGTPWLPMPETE